MKEATGELNSTIIVVVSIGVLATFFFSYLWPSIKHNFEKESQCNKASCDCSSKVREQNEGYCLCTLNNGGESFRCVYKG